MAAVAEQRRRYVQEAGGSMEAENVASEIRLMQEVELGGALGRKAAAEGFYQRGQDFAAWTVRIKAIPGLLEQRERALSIWRTRDIARLEKQVAEPGAEMQPLQLAREVIVVHPVVFE